MDATAPASTSQGNLPQANAIAAPVISSVATNSQATPQVSSRAKESAPIQNELTGFVEVAGNDAFEKEPLPPEVSSWMEKVSRDAGGERPQEIVINQATGVPPSVPTAAPPVYVLPLGQTDMTPALHKNVSDSIRWLATWCQKIMKKLGEKVVYR